MRILVRAMRVQKLHEPSRTVALMRTRIYDNGVNEQPTMSTAYPAGRYNTRPVKFENRTVDIGITWIEYHQQLNDQV